MLWVLLTGDEKVPHGWCSSSEIRLGLAMRCDVEYRYEEFFSVVWRFSENREPEWNSALY